MYVLYRTIKTGGIVQGAIVFLVLVCQRSNIQAALIKVRSMRENFSQILPSVPLTGMVESCL
jgi:hypothetical protein